MCENTNDRDRKVFHFNYRILIINNLSYLYRKVDSSLNIGKRKTRAMWENRRSVKKICLEVLIDTIAKVLKCYLHFWLAQGLVKQKQLILMFLLSQASLSRSVSMYMRVRWIHLSICVPPQRGGLAWDVEQHLLFPHPHVLPARLCLNRSVNALWKRTKSQKSTVYDVCFW